MPYISEENRLTLRKIRERHGLSMDIIAASAEISISKVWLLENSGYLPERDIDTILAVLSRITGEHYTRNNVGGYWTGGAEDALRVEFRYG